MRTRQNHLIKTCHLDLAMPYSEQVQSIENQIKNKLFSSILPTLSRKLDKTIDPDQFISLDQLIIDLGEIAIKDLDEKVETQVIRTLMHEVQLQTQKHHLSRSSRRNTQDTFYYFLDHGSLPWNASVKNIRVLEDALLTDQLDWTELLQKCRNETIRKRLCHQFSLGFYQLFIHEVAISLNAQQIYARVFQNDEILQSTEHRMLLVEYLYFLSTYAKDHDKEIAAGSVKDMMQHMQTEIFTKKKNDVVPQEKVDPLLHKIYTLYAGTVLAHTFLPKLFEKLQLDLLNQIQDREKAVHILYFMATGNLNPEEHLCPLFENALRPGSTTSDKKICRSPRR